MVTLELRTASGDVIAIFTAYTDKSTATITWGAKHFVLDEFDDKRFIYVEANNLYILEGHNCRRVR